MIHGFIVVKVQVFENDVLLLEWTGEFKCWSIKGLKLLPKIIPVNCFD